MGLPLHFSESYTRWLGFNHTHDFVIEIEQIVSSTGDVLEYRLSNCNPDMVDQINRISILDYPASLNKLLIDQDPSALFRGESRRHVLTIAKLAWIVN
jgi:hypothetical protein